MFCSIPKEQLILFEVWDDSIHVKVFTVLLNFQLVSFYGRLQSQKLDQYTKIWASKLAALLTVLEKKKKNLYSFDWEFV